MIKNLSAKEEMQVPSLGQEDPLENEMYSFLKYPWNTGTLKYSCLENPMDRGVYWTTAHGGTKESDTTYKLNTKSNNN